MAVQQVGDELLTRTREIAEIFVELFREQVWAVDPNQPISYVRSMEEILDGEVFDDDVARCLGRPVRVAPDGARVISELFA